MAESVLPSQNMAIKYGNKTYSFRFVSYIFVKQNLINVFNCTLYTAFDFYMVLAISHPAALPILANH